jgi:hypothetical protein
MTIIYGDTETGKSTIATSLIRNKKNSLYILLDKDIPIMNQLKKDKTEFHLINDCFLLDLKYRLLERGGLINNDLEYVVIDSINLIKDQKNYLEKIKYIDEMAKDFKIKIILVFNTLKNLDKVRKFLNSIEGHKTIDVENITQQVSQFPL